MKPAWRKTTLIILALIFTILVGFVLGRNSIDAPLAATNVLNQLKKIQLDLVAPPKDRTATVDSEQPTILIETPAINAFVADQFAVTGRAKATTSSVVINAKDANGALIATTTAKVTVDPNTTYGRFAGTISLRGYQGALVLEVIPNNDASAVVQRQLTAGQPTSSTPPPSGNISISVFFTKSSGNLIDCSQVSAVARTIDPNKNAYRQAIEALLAGPTAAELASGYITSIPSGAKLRSITVDAQGKVTADFETSIQKGVAGSCRVGAIRAQIEQTLLQFPEVREVAITVRGDADNVLQP